MDQPYFPVTRDAALARLAAFVPLAGPAYAAGRNHDHGPARHRAVSRLSAALRRRVVSEREVCDAVLARHGLDGAEKFIAEVFWRTYWKGWLEARPSVWTRYLARVEALRSGRKIVGLAKAEAGATGIDAFDHWAGELAETGYLHNWSRMQFASIWVFTLGLPWEMGAAHMLAHLRDGDAASNTLSWRWVAGLHTAGKAYLADGDRIARMTGGRFAPRGLARVARIPDEAPVPSASAPRAPRGFDPAASSLLWVTGEDASLETELPRLPVRGVVACRNEVAHPDDALALEDAVARASARWGVPTQWLDDEAALAEAASAAGVRQVVTGFATVGPAAERLSHAAKGCTRVGVTLGEHLRRWDRASWPHCRKGFFALKTEIPRLLDATAPVDA